VFLGSLMEYIELLIFLFLYFHNVNYIVTILICQEYIFYFLHEWFINFSDQDCFLILTIMTKEVD
jgi:hypothetical protein